MSGARRKLGAGGKSRKTYGIASHLDQRESSVHNPKCRASAVDLDVLDAKIVGEVDCSVDSAGNVGVGDGEDGASGIGGVSKSGERLVGEPHENGVGESDVGVRAERCQRREAAQVSLARRWRPFGEPRPTNCVSYSSIGEEGRDVTGVGRGIDTGKGRCRRGCD